MKTEVLGALTLGLLLAASSYGFTQVDRTERFTNDRQITIRIVDYAHVKSPELHEAERVAGGILRHAGVHSVWADCPGGQTSFADPVCTSPVTPLDFFVNVLPRSMSERLRVQEGVLGGALESKEDFGFRAYIYYDSVKNYAGEIDLGQFLGDVFAHELGHLLLGPSSHSSRGLMCARWSEKELLIAQQGGGLSFSPSEAKRIEMALLARRLAGLREATSREGHAHSQDPTGPAVVAR
jgi:hypothetical protein